MQAVGGFTHLIDDDWYILKRAAALGTGVHLVLFNPDPETEDEFSRDEAAWLVYRNSLVSKMQEMGAIQGAIVSEQRGDQRHARLKDLTARLREVEQESIRSFVHLYDRSPAR